MSECKTQGSECTAWIDVPDSCPCRLEVASLPLLVPVQVQTPESCTSDTEGMNTTRSLARPQFHSCEGKTCRPWFGWAVSPLRSNLSFSFLLSYWKTPWMLLHPQGAVCHPHVCPQHILVPALSHHLPGCPPEQTCPLHHHQDHAWSCCRCPGEAQTLQTGLWVREGLYKQHVKGGERCFQRKAHRFGIMESEQ